MAQQWPTVNRSPPGSIPWRRTLATTTTWPLRLSRRSLARAQHLTSAEEPVDQLLPSLGLFRHVQEQQPLYPALVRGLARDPHYLAVHRLLRDRAAEQLALAAGSHTLGVPPEIIADYLAGTLLSLVHWWLDHGSLYSPEQMEAFFQQLVMPGVRTLLHQ